MTGPADTSASTYVEPWLRGTHTDVPAAGRAVLHALELALDDLKQWTADLSDEEMHAHPLGLNSIAFLLRHIARSTDRILTYGEGNQLSAAQFTAYKAEQGAEQGEEGKHETRAELMAEVESTFARAAERIRALAAADLDTFRGVGRKNLPTSIGGTMLHVADHTMRHVGQVITTAKVLKAQRG
jgi:uncharacterized damage-inducible protein DinB